MSSQEQCEIPVKRSLPWQAANCRRLAAIHTNYRGIKRNKIVMKCC